MKRHALYISLIFAAALVSCKNEEAPKPKVIYENNSKSKTEAPTDTTQIEVADLPVNMEGTNFLIHPVGTISGAGKNGKSDSQTSFTVSNYGEYQITGYLKNLKFQEIGKDSIYTLTDKSVVIETATYLKNFADKSKQQLMLYSVADIDTNKDGKLDNSDIKSLYMSTISGHRFTKLSPEFQELIDWKIVESKNLLFFRTVQDVSKNGEFGKNDVVHYFYVQLTDKEWKPIEYSPV